MSLSSTWLRSDLKNSEISCALIHVLGLLHIYDIAVVRPGQLCHSGEPQVGHTHEDIQLWYFCVVNSFCICVKGSSSPSPVFPNSFVYPGSSNLCSPFIRFMDSRAPTLFSGQSFGQGQVESRNPQNRLRIVGKTDFVQMFVEMQGSIRLSFHLRLNFLKGPADLDGCATLRERFVITSRHRPET